MLNPLLRLLAKKCHVQPLLRLLVHSQPTNLPFNPPDFSQPEIDKILRFVPPKEKRQTLLFSATVPKTVQTIAASALRPGFSYVDTVGEEEQTHLHVKQEIVTLPLSQHVAGLAAILHRVTHGEANFKVIVFFTTARVTGFMAQLFTEMGDFGEVLEIHSRKSQSQRTKTSEQVRSGKLSLTSAGFRFF